MSTYKSKTDFVTSEDGVLILQLLKAMVVDGKYHTAPSYSANSTLYADNLIPFVDKHMSYLRDHPRTDPYQYVANLRLMTKLK